MVVRIIFLIFLIFSSCQSSQDSKGENIPDQKFIQVGQNAQKNVQFLTLQIEDQPSSNLYFLRAKNYVVLHAYGLADQDLEKALRDNPGESDYLALSAKVKQQVEDYATSIDRAKLVEATDYNSPQNNLLLAQNYLATNQMSLARLYIKKLDVSSFSSADRIKLKAVNDFLLSDSSRLFELMEVKPKDDSPLVYIYYSEGLDVLPSLRYQKEILASLKSYPLDPFLMRYWARFLVKMKKYDQAASVYKQVVKVYPRTKSLTAELVYFDLAKQGKLPVQRSKSFSDSLI
jgi:tetratricopeptide (TPR) repeat protein